MKLHFLLNQRAHPEPNSTFAIAMRLLERRGFEVSSAIPEEALCSPDDLYPEHDLYLLKSQSELSLSLAGALHDRGGRFLNPYPACALLQNKIAAASRLAAAGVAVPHTWVTGDFELLREVASSMPLIVKPYRGPMTSGIVVVLGSDNLAGLVSPEQPMLVQHFIHGTGDNLKVYVVDEQVFAVSMPFSARAMRGAGVPCAVSETVRDIALRCGRTFGLGLYGLDIVEGPDGPVVVDVDYCPGFRGVPEIAPVIAGYIEDVASARASLATSLPPLKQLWG